MNIKEILVELKNIVNNMLKKHRNLEVVHLQNQKSIGEDNGEYFEFKGTDSNDAVKIADKKINDICIKINDALRNIEEMFKQDIVTAARKARTPKMSKSPKIKTKKIRIPRGINSYKRRLYIPHRFVSGAVVREDFTDSLFSRLKEDDVEIKSMSFIYDAREGKCQECIKMSNMLSSELISRFMYARNFSFFTHPNCLCVLSISFIYDGRPYNININHRSSLEKFDKIFIE